MRYSEEFFALQIRFACRVAELSGLPLERTLLDYTNLYMRLGLGRGFDAGHPVWIDFVSGFLGAENRPGWTYRYILSRGRHSVPPSLVATFGCFSYACEQGGRIRLHFQNAEPTERSPLGVERIDVRLMELRALFEHVKRTQHGVHRAAGVSWLYNLPAYRRLFPESYLATARTADRRFRNMPLWGQFVHRHGNMRADTVAVFLDRLSRHAGREHLAGCFPLQPLAVEAPLPEFYAFHRID